MTLAEVLLTNHIRPQSSGQYRGTCPFRENHTTGSDGSNSFFISPEINAYHCFSCKSKGKLLDLLIKKFKVPMSEAVKYVTINVSAEKNKPSSDIPDLIVDYSKPPKMLLKRGLFKQTLRKFKVGSYVNEKGQEVAVIPILNSEGVLVAVKYRINTPKGKVMWSTKYEKSFFYNQTDSCTAILVEGESDTMRAVQNGYPNTWGLLGSALTKEQYKILKTLNTLYIATDRDEAGLRIAEEVYEALYREVKILFVPYPKDDPEKCSRREWDAAVKNSTGYAEYSLAMQKLFGLLYLKVKKDIKKAKKFSLHK
jgi:DNA primase